MRGSTPKVIFFDLDSTLIFQTESAEACWREACCQYEGELQSIPLDKVVEAIDAQAEWFWSDPVRHKTGRLELRKARRGIAVEALRSLGLAVPELAETIADRMSDRREVSIALAPEAVETLIGLRSRGIRLGMITNGDSEGQRYKISRFELEPYFEAIQIEGEVGIGKPEEGVYELALQNMGVIPAEAWMVGDDLVWDIQAAQKAGLGAIWLEAAGKGLPDGSIVLPDHTIQSLKELLFILEKLTL